MRKYVITLEASDGPVDANDPFWLEIPEGFTREEAVVIWDALGLMWKCNMEKKIGYKPRAKRG